MSTELSLYDLNKLVKGLINNSFDELFWVRAETSDVRYNQNGHCYLEFIEKDINNRNIIAKARGSIWSNVFRLLKAYFESETGQTFTSGLKVLVQVSIEFHELYGYSLNVHNIDPTYTLGDQARNRALIIKQLEEEGVLNLNKELNLPELTNRIAIISSPTAAGYEDFCKQLENNLKHFVFYTKLFPAIMQGEQTENSIIEALDNIYGHADYFDAVVIIRGGGATSDLSCFDSYLLAANCAQFPLPIITGIGHERDETVLDIVAHTKAKTPTAVAEFLINHIENTLNELKTLEEKIINSTNQKVSEETFLLQHLQTKYMFLVKDISKDQINKIQNYKDRLTSSVNSLFQKQNHKLESIEQYIDLVSPENILKKGYTLTIYENKIIKTKPSLPKGTEIETVFSDGKIKTIIQ